MILLLASRSAFAEPNDEAMELRPNSVAVQAGVLPNVSFIGVELKRSLTTHLEVSLSGSYGFAAVAAVIPRIAFPLAQHVVLAVGAGPSFVYEKGLLEESRTYAQAIADLELDVVTADQWLLQVRGGISAYRDDGSSNVIPFVGLGIGRVW